MVRVAPLIAAIGLSCIGSACDGWWIVELRENGSLLIADSDVTSVAVQLEVDGIGSPPGVVVKPECAETFCRNDSLARRLKGHAVAFVIGDIQAIEGDDVVCAVV